MFELPFFVQALLKPEAYQEQPPTVELAQTHISYLFFTSEHVYKVKKPVDFGFLDFSTLEKRRYYCHQEVELNRRLSPDVYLGVVEVRQDGERIAIDGDGDVIEYAVKMRRLPAEAFADKLLASNQLTEAMVGELAQILADFHRHADTSPEISRYGSQESIGANLDENFGQIEKYIGIAIPNGKFQHIKDYSYRFAEKRSGLFKRRTKSGRIRDCHGDVHSAQVCFTPDGVRIIDCIEFTERFRYCDVASEIAFMAMDLDFHNRHDLSLAFVDAYVSASSDEEIRELLDFYKVYLACVRGKVESFRLDDPHLSGNDRVVAQERARRYFDLAYAYSLKGQKSAILAITSGLVGAGKTTVAQAIGAEAGFVVISSDVVRKRLAGIPPTSHRYEDFDSGIYTQEFSERTYNEMFRLAGRLLQEGYSVVMDATFRHPEDRIKAVALSEEAGAQFWAVECVCDEAVVRERLERRVEEDASVSDGRWEIYLWEKEIAVPLSDVPQGRHLVVDTSRLSLVEAVVTVLEAMELRVPADGASR